MDKIQSLQDAFNRVWNHYIVKHHTFAFDKEEQVPVMQDAEGNKDPVRVLIPDNKFRETFEKMSHHDIMTSRGLQKYFDRLKYHADFLDNLTAVHDRAAEDAFSTSVHINGLRARACYRAFRRTLKDGLHAIALEYGLTIPSSRPYPTYVAAKKKASKKK